MSGPLDRFARPCKRSLLLYSDDCVVSGGKSSVIRAFTLASLYVQLESHFSIKLVSFAFSCVQFRVSIFCLASSTVLS